MNTSIRHENESDLLARLCAEIEEAWLIHRDVAVVDRVTNQHPEHEGALYDFFELLLEAEMEGREDSEEAAAISASLRRWLEQEGYRLGRETAAQERTGSTPTAPAAPAAGESSKPLEHQGREATASPPLVGLLRQWTHRRLDDIAREMDISKALLTQVSERPDVVPLTWKREIARRAKQSFDIPPGPVMTSLETTPEYARAASRDAPYEPEVLTAEDLLARADMSEDERAFWRSLSDRDV
jgi:hypothetical protein